MLSLAIRKLIVVGLVVSVFLLANALILAFWLDEVGVIAWASSIRQEFLTGTAITVILALLILLAVPRVSSVHASVGFRRCPVCDRLLLRAGKYCSDCGSRL